MTKLDLTEIYKRSFSAFCRNIMHQEVADFYLDIIKHIESQMKKEMNKTHLAIMVSRGHGKTITFSRSFPLWLIYRATSPITVLIESMNQDMSRRILGLSRDVILSNPYFAGFKFKKETDKLLEIYLPGFEGNAEMTHKLYSVPVGTRGLHADVVISDDIQKDEAGKSVTNLQKLKSTWWNATYPMANAKNGIHLFIGTPISHNDMFNDIEKIIADGGNWELFKYPAILKDEDGNERSLFPALYPMDKLMEIKAATPEWSWLQEYMLIPIGQDAMFPIDLINQCTTIDYVLTPEAKKNLDFYIGCDVAMSSNSKADYSAFFVISKAPGLPMKIEHIWHERGVDEPEQINVIKNLRHTYDITKGLIERKGLTYSMAQKVVTDPELAGIMDYWNPTNEEKGKILGNLHLLMKHKMLYIPKDIEHYEELISELMSFGVINENGTQKYRAISGHDDLIIGLALAVSAAGGWVFDERVPYSIMMF